ncbi:MAG: hypothetical protein Q8L13_18480 [Bradyrhizobium sp.]|uniref:hypothetical protein n=1 Tax=Bradyrhizobium sp. TaxID=376 RepID=UPI00273065A0|nr:hypothetical protein [Bradyrhizobium sp.]MDP1868310.1 hypothetical protein [Bradyrhizobium sp.]
MSVEKMPDQRLIHYYENIRQQADADRALKFHFTAAPTIRDYADRRRNEMIRRRLQHRPIEWPSSRTGSPGR